MKLKKSHICHNRFCIFLNSKKNFTFSLGISYIRTFVGMYLVYLWVLFCASLSVLKKVYFLLFSGPIIVTGELTIGSLL